MRESREGKDRGNVQRTYTYVDGNTVRKLEAAEELEQLPLREPERNREAERKRRQEKMKRLQGMELFSVLFLVVAVLFTAFCCVKYLKVQAQVTTSSKQLAKLESQILELKEENKETEDSITSNVDLDYIYKKATKKLGMVHPKKNQVVTYESTDSDTVKQYGNIPESDTKN